MNLHYSQTMSPAGRQVHCLIPLWIYITLKQICFQVLQLFCLIPLWIYITLKRLLHLVYWCVCLIPLWIYITLKLFPHPESSLLRLIPLWIYITLKRQRTLCKSIYSLIPLWIYITLKPIMYSFNTFAVLYLYEFTLLSNHTYARRTVQQSYTSMNLHYSQTR